MNPRGDPSKLRTRRWGVPPSLARALETDEADFPTRQQMRRLEASFGSLLAASTVVPAAAAAARGSWLAWVSPLAAKIAIPLALGAATGAVFCVAGEYLAARRTAVRMHSPTPSESPPRAAPAEISPPPLVAPAAPSATVAPQPIAQAAPPMKLGSHPGSHAKRSAVETEPSREAPSAMSEIDLIDRAERALLASPESARAWLEEHRSRFPDGVFVEERELMAIEAAARTGARDEARRRAVEFQRRFSTSPYRARIENMLRGAGGS
jgi:hypothetical protein